MHQSNPAHLRKLAETRAVLALLAGSDDGGAAVSSVLAGDEDSGELAGVTLAQRLRYIDVVDGDDSALAAADEITNVISANHGDHPLAAVAANLDLVRLLRVILQTTDVDYRLLAQDLRTASPQEKVTANVLIRLGSIRRMVESVVDLLGPDAADADADDDVDAGAGDERVRGAA